LSDTIGTSPEIGSSSSSFASAAFSSTTVSPSDQDPTLQRDFTIGDMVAAVSRFEKGDGYGYAYAGPLQGGKNTQSC
jgi:hypothetical protein